MNIGLGLSANPYMNQEIVIERGDCYETETYPTKENRKLKFIQARVQSSYKRDQLSRKH